jgi:hypothetical protein
MVFSVNILMVPPGPSLVLKVSSMGALLTATRCGLLGLLVIVCMITKIVLIISLVNLETEELLAHTPRINRFPRPVPLDLLMAVPPMVLFVTLMQIVLTTMLVLWNSVLFSQMDNSIVLTTLSFSSVLPISVTRAICVIHN